MIRFTLDTILRDYLNLKDENSPHTYARLVRIDKMGLRDFNLDISGAPKTVQLDLDLNLLTAPLTNDYITYKRIGMCINGRMFPLGYNPDMCKLKTFDDCGNVEAKGTGETGVFMPQPLHVRNGEQMGAYFGLGGGNSVYGYYMINEPQGEIQFSSLLSGHEVVLEYLS